MQSICDNRIVQGILQKCPELKIQIRCPRPNWEKRKECSEGKNLCAFPGYNLSLQPSDDDSEYIKQKKKVLLNEIEKKYKHLEGRKNPITKIIEDWISEVIAEKNPGLEKEDTRQITVSLGDNNLKIGVDCLFSHNESQKLIMVELKSSFGDSNSVRSAILNAMLVKECGKPIHPFENYEVHFYYVGNYWGDIEYYKKQYKKSNVTTPLMQWALKKRYIDGFYGLKKIQDLTNNIKNKLELNKKY